MDAQYRPNAAAAGNSLPPPFTPAPLPEPYVLAWDPEADINHVSDSISEPPVSGLPLSEPPLAIPTDLPPGYSTAHRPTTNMTYSLSPTGSNAMMVVPPASAPDSRPQYYITVSMDVMMPLAHITTVYRGASEYGEKVGAFRMGIISAPAIVHLKGSRPSHIGTILNKYSGSRTSGVWRWQPGSKGRTHEWNYSDTPYRTAKCMSMDRTLLAQYRYGDQMDLMGVPELEVTPAGQKYFDHILISLLIIERKRLTPGAAYTKELFSR